MGQPPTSCLKFFEINENLIIFIEPEPQSEKKEAKNRDQRYHSRKKYRHETNCQRVGLKVTEIEGPCIAERLQLSLYTLRVFPVNPVVPKFSYLPDKKVRNVKQIDHVDYKGHLHHVPDKERTHVAHVFGDRFEQIIHFNSFHHKF